MGIRTVLVFFSYQICSEGKKVPVVNCGGSPTLCFKESLNKTITHSEALNKVQTEQSSLAKVEGKFPLSRWLPQAGQWKNKTLSPLPFNAAPWLLLMIPSCWATSACNAEGRGRSGTGLPPQQHRWSSECRAMHWGRIRNSFPQQLSGNTWESFLMSGK